MNSSTPLFAATAFVAVAVLAARCTSEICPQAGGSCSAKVMVVGAASAWAPMLPMNVKVCAEECQIFRVERDDGATICRPMTSVTPVGLFECRFNEAGDAMLLVAVGSAGTHAISLTATNDANAQLFQRTGSVEATAFYPGGPECGSSCFQGSTNLQP